MGEEELARHPFMYLVELFSKEEAIFYFSKYIYIPDALSDERQIIKVPSHEMSVDWVLDQFRSLNEEQELAIHSTVKIKGRVMHIPMIDFSIEEGIDGNIFQRMNNFLPKKVLENIVFFDSGRSYHAYSDRLLRPSEWINFMGRLLLINLKNSNEIVDSRWIGHRLLGGYSSLRWSNNTAQYLSIPTSYRLSAKHLVRV